MVARAGKAADFGFLVHSHMMQHSTGYKSPTTGTTRTVLGFTSNLAAVLRTLMLPARAILIRSATLNLSKGSACSSTGRPGVGAKSRFGCPSPDDRVMILSVHGLDCRLRAEVIRFGEVRREDEEQIRRIGGS